MLVLTRKAGQSVVVGNSIRVTIVETSAGGVRLGFEAPAEVSIYREEIYVEIARANQAVLANPSDEDEPAAQSVSQSGDKP